MRKRIISAAGLICCLAAVYMSAQAGKKDFYENQTSLADEEYELMEIQPSSSTIVDENTEHEYYNLVEEQPNSAPIADENTENEGYETAPISEINVGENAGHEYIEE